MSGNTSGWWGLLQQEIFIDARRIPLVIVSALVIYLVFLVLMRALGPRVFTSITELDAVVLIMFGAVAGRVIIGHPPTLASGVIALITLVVLELAFGALRRASGERRLVITRPRVLIAHGRLLQGDMRRCHISEAEVWTVLRQSGVASLAEVQCLVLEPTGSFSVLREGAEIDPRVLDGVVGAQQVLGERR